MTHQEFQRLLGYWRAKQHAPKNTLSGKRLVKGKAKGYCQILKSSRVIPQVNIETLFLNHP